jgi:hypothetical protein
MFKITKWAENRAGKTSRRNIFNIVNTIVILAMFRLHNYANTKISEVFLDERILFLVSLPVHQPRHTDGRETGRRVPGLVGPRP